MSDLNEQSFSAGTTTDTASVRRPKTLRQRIRAPIWRFNPTIQPVRAVATIIPKIVLALRKSPTVKIDDAAKTDVPGSVEQFAALALGKDEGAAFTHIEALVAQGVAVESIFLDLLAPTARYLGTLWEQDATDFATVTLAVGRLQRVLWRLGESFVAEGQRGGGESILLSIIPGEQHSFGLSMVAEFFRRAGWNLCTGPFSSHLELTSLVHSHWFDVIGFSISSDRRLDELRKDIQDIRRNSRNRSVGVMLGGPMVMAHPDLVAKLGADIMSADATTAPQQARELIDQIKGRA